MENLWFCVVSVWTALHVRRHFVLGFILWLVIPLLRGSGAWFRILRGSGAWFQIRCPEVELEFSILGVQRSD